MFKHSAQIVHDLLSDFLEILLEDTHAKPSRVLILRFPVDPRTGLLDQTCFTCYKAKELSVQYITKEWFWLYNFLVEFRDWKEHLDEYDDFCSNKL